MKRWFRFAWRTKLSALRKVGGILGGAAGVLLAMVTMTASSGCDSGSFIPPPPEELRGSDGASGSASSPGSAPVGWEPEPAAAKTIELVLDRRDVEQAGLVTAAARKQGGFEKVGLKIALLGEQDLPARQVDLVREALARHPLALIVEPSDPTDRRLAQVIDEARGEGVPVVLLNRPLAGDQGAGPNAADTKAAGNGPAQPSAGQGAATAPKPGSRKPMVLIKPPSFTASAQQLVASALRNAKSANLDPQGGAIIMINTKGDSFIQERALAIRKVLEAIGIKTIEEISFSKESEIGTKLLTERLDANPKLVMVFSVDSLSTVAARETIYKIVLDRPFIVAGYSAEKNIASTVRAGDFAAVAEYVPTQLIRKSVATAVELARGEDVPSVVEVPIVFYDSPEDSSTARSPANQKKRREKEEARSSTNGS